MKSMFKVIAQTEPVTVQKQDGSTILKSTAVLQLAGGKYEDSFSATLLGNLATRRLAPGDIVWAALRFQAREYHPQQGGTTYLQDITVQEIIKMGGAE
ncbi:MAG: hypothetical protein ACI3YT_05385 [Prevotella sp.]